MSQQPLAHLAVHLRQLARPPARRLRQQMALAAARLSARMHPADLALFHDFAPPPAGGGHQFLRALWRELEQQGWRLEKNTCSPTTRACLCNGHNFAAERLRALRRAGVPIVHRVDGPVGVYRGRGPDDDPTDQRVWQINRDLASATILQSRYSLLKHQELGYSFVEPHIIPNTPDPTLFHAVGRIESPVVVQQGQPVQQRKVRLISTSWSDNPNKGAAVYQWLEEHLDWQRFDYTFVGRSPLRFRRIRTLPPLPSHQLAHVLRRHDIVITASRHDPCSNALLEALACGLPALYLNSGGHPELVGQAGFAFESAEELPALLDRLVADYPQRQEQISLPPLPHVAARYLAVLGLA